MPVSLLEALMGTSVDLKGLETGLQKMETMAEDALKKVSQNFGLIATGIVTAIAGSVIIALEKAIHTTAEWGLEMEHLSNRMGMTAQQAATLVGVMERFGIQAGVAARSLQIMTSEAKQTQDALDPFATRMGKVLGPLKEMNGQAMNMSQVFDLARQKISSMATETEKLQVAQALVGTRMAGQLLPILKLSNTEWEKQKASVEGVIGPVNKAAEEALAYKQATQELEQSFRGLEVELGTKVLPAITEIVHSFSALVGWYKEFKDTSAGAVASNLNPWNIFKGAIDATNNSLYKTYLSLGLIDKVEYDGFVHASEYAKARAEANANEEKAKDAAEETAAAVERTEKREKELVALVKERVTLAEKAKALGFGDDKGVQAALQAQLQQLSEQRALLEKQRDELPEGDSRLAKEVEISKNRIAAAEAVSRVVSEMYKQEELELKAVGALNLGNEIVLLQRKLNDERVVGDERLKIEAELFQKRKEYEENVVKFGRQLGFLGVDDEIAYRKQKAAEALGRGDAFGAAQEIVKARDLALQQADQVMEFTKKIRIVSLQDEINFQKQKLEAVKGNAEEEIKILSTIADKDKQLYDQRLQFSLTYTQNVVGQYEKIMDAARKGGEVQTFEFARAQSDRQLVEATREAGGVLRGGGTASQREAAVGFAQFVNKQIEEMETQGRNITSIWRDAASTANDILRAASGGEEVRAPGGPSPTIGSLLSPAEGLATEGLARGSDIPRLDTSFTDLAIRVRDVLLGVVPNIQNFSNAVADASKRIAIITGTPLNPGIVGPGGGTTTLPTQGSGQLATSGQTTGPPTTGPGGSPTTPSNQVGISSLANSDTLGRKIDDLISALAGLPDKVSGTLQDQNAANAESLLAALNQASRQRVDVNVTMDPNTGDILVNRIATELSQ